MFGGLFSENSNHSWPSVVAIALVCIVLVGSLNNANSLKMESIGTKEVGSIFVDSSSNFDNTQSNLPHVRANRVEMGAQYHVTDLVGAVELVSPSKQAFAFYHLNLTVQQHNLLTSATFAKGGNVSPFIHSEIHSVNEAHVEIVNKFFERVFGIGDDKQRTNNVIGNDASAFTQLAFSLVHSILSATHRSHARVSLFANPFGIGDVATDWHLDKTLTEEMRLSNGNGSYTTCSESDDCDSCSSDRIFLIALKGSATDYREVSNQLRAQFVEQTVAVEEADQVSHTPHTYSCFNCHSLPLWEKSKVYNADTAWLYSLDNDSTGTALRGAVHLAGAAHGAMHTTPPGDNRVVLKVFPQSESVISMLNSQ